MTPKEKIYLVARLQGELLREQRLGHPEWYAEMLFAAAYDGELMLTNHPKYDLRTERWGTMQVKCRVNGTDTSQNRANFGKYSIGDFDHAAIVLFEADYRILDAVVLPCVDVLPLVKKAGHVRWYDAQRHPRAVSVAGEIRWVSGERMGRTTLIASPTQ